MKKDQKNLIDISKEVESYEKFAFGKNLLSMSVVIILATSLQKFVASTSDNILMPVVYFFINHTTGNWRSFNWEPIKGMKFEIGALFGGFLEFFITTIILYLIYYKFMVGLLKIPEEDIESNS